jgi:septal ring factor EnvC (AmiA/AmiB activator)
MSDNTSELLQFSDLLRTALQRAVTYQSQRDTAEAALRNTREQLAIVETERNAFYAELQRLNERINCEDERVLFAFYPGRLTWEQAGETFANVFHILTGGSRDPIDMAVLVENGRHFVTTQKRLNCYMRAMPQCMFQKLGEHEAQNPTEI